jgi:hypothetical protein
VAEEVDAFLMGDTRLPHQGGMPMRSWHAPPVTKKDGAIVSVESAESTDTGSSGGSDDEVEASNEATPVAA